MASKDAGEMPEELRRAAAGLAFLGKALVDLIQIFHMDLVFAQHHDIDPAGFLGQGQQVLPVDPRRGQRIFLETL